MSVDFFYAFITGWAILFFFWMATLLFIFIRKPPKSKLSLSLAVKSIVFFISIFLIIFIFS